MGNADAMGLTPMPQDHIMRLDTRNSDTNVGRSGIPIHVGKQDKVIFLINGELPAFIYLMDDRFLKNQEVIKVIKELRGGSWSIPLIGNIIFLGVFFSIWILAESFVVPAQPNPGWGLGNNLYEPPGLVRPADCETQLYAGSPQQSLKTEASRNQPNPKDRWILVESRPELIIRRGQTQFKTKDHGALVVLPYTIKKWRNFNFKN